MPEDIASLDIEEIKERVIRAISVFGGNEQDILHPLGSERNICQRLSYYLQNEFVDWHVDTDNDKIIDGTTNTTRRKVARLLIQRFEGRFIHLNEPKETMVIPDIIVHRRKTRENLLAIEVKIHNDRQEIDFDHEKLKAYCLSEDLFYRFAFFVRFQELDQNGKFVAETRYFTA